MGLTLKHQGKLKHRAYDKAIAMEAIMLRPITTWVLPYKSKEN